MPASHFLMAPLSVCFFGSRNPNCWSSSQQPGRLRRPEPNVQGLAKIKVRCQDLMTAPWLTPFRDYPYRPQRCVCHLLFLTGSPLDNGYDALREKFPPNEKNFPLLTALKIKTANLSLDQM